MKKFLIIFGLVLGFASAVYADGHFCCDPSLTKEQCCAGMGKMYCPNDNSCRTRCLNVTPPECIGGCINPECKCCAWCPTVEVCARMGKCQKIVDGCYQCVECSVPNPCPAPQCMNEEGVCCDSCPRTCPDNQCLVKDGNGCYVCGECRCDDDDDDEPTETTEPSRICTGVCEVYENGKCVDKTMTKWTGECCDEDQ